VVVESVSTRKRDEEIARLFEPMGKRVVALASGYGEADQAVIVEFLTKACEILEEETTRLRAMRCHARRV
jgi:uncharacterized protein with GYD domain